MTAPDHEQAERLTRIFQRLADGYGIPTYDAGFLAKHADALAAQLAERERALREIIEYCDACNGAGGFPSTVTLRQIAATHSDSEGACHGRCGEEYGNFNCPECRSDSEASE